MSYNILSIAVVDKLQGIASYMVENCVKTVLIDEAKRKILLDIECILNQSGSH